MEADTWEGRKKRGKEPFIEKRGEALGGKRQKNQAVQARGKTAIRGDVEKKKATKKAPADRRRKKKERRRKLRRKPRTC